jgi:hypothetical protein
MAPRIEGSDREELYQAARYVISVCALATEARIELLYEHWALICRKALVLGVRNPEPTLL